MDTEKMSCDYYLCKHENNRYKCGAKDLAERQRCKGFFVNGNVENCHYYCPNADNTCQCPSAMEIAFLPSLKDKGK